MQTVTVAQAKNQLSSLIHAVEMGDEIVLTRHGKPVVRLVAEQPIKQSHTDARLEAQALAQLDASRDKLRGKVSFADWKSLRDEGRRL